MKKILLACLLFLSIFCNAQTNVRAWYADGQVWVVWEVSVPLPDWYGVYVKNAPFTSTDNAIGVGKLHKFEYSCAALKEQVDTAATPRIPGPQGSAAYQLKPNEGLFVFTPHQAGQLYFAVTANDEKTVTAGQNITPNAIPFVFAPVNDPVECHLQATFPSPFASGFACFAFMMWSDGRDNENDSRPDFPVMANAAKNGMPNLFLVSVPIGLDTTQPFPMSVWLHGGGGTARQSLAGSRQDINIKPEEGILLAHDDNLIGWRLTAQPFIDMPSWHFGWLKHYDPFHPNNPPLAGDTIINYTQRRYLWIDDWMIRHFNIDPTRINLHGHSMGSAGTTALAKCFPEHYASITIFNNGFAGPDSTTNVVVFGDPDLNYPTNIKNKQGETVRLKSLWNLLDNCSSSRDLPLIRNYHSKNDDNGIMHWSPYVVENFRKADSLGIGVQTMWSERAHGVDTGPDYNDHWVSGLNANQQTEVDDVAFAESRYRSNLSFPAFFNHRLDPQNNDPGVGTIGINNGDGDNWGTWGGYHRWKVLNETEGEWVAEAWLESNALYGNDNCPNDYLTADMMIRRPQQIISGPGWPYYYYVQDGNNGNYLQTGAGIANEDGLITLQGIVVYRENIRKVIIHVLGSTPVRELAGVKNATLFPNPSTGMSVLRFQQDGDEPLSLRISGVNGLVSTQTLESHKGSQQIPLDLSAYEPGVYFVSLASPTGIQTWKLFLQQ